MGAHGIPRLILKRVGFQVAVGATIGLTLGSFWSNWVHNWQARVNDYYKQLYRSHPELLDPNRNLIKLLGPSDDE